VVLVGLLWVFRPREVPLGELVRIVPDLLRLVRGLIADVIVAVIVLRYVRRRVGFDDLRRRWPRHARGLRASERDCRL
jgi:hypothetical protein